MENATEALRMAGGVLIFLLALSISINAFSQSRQGIDNLVLYSDREFLSTYVEQNKGTQRIVGAESIVPTIYRAYKENIKIEFLSDDFQKNATGCLYMVKDYEGRNPTYMTTIDLEDETHGDEMLKEYYLRKILFASEIIVKQLYQNEDRDSDYTNCQSKISGNLAFNSRGLYDRLTSSRKQYVEKLGVFYRGEENGTTDKSTINKTEKKVITYEDVNP